MIDHLPDLRGQPLDLLLVPLQDRQPQPLRLGREGRLFEVHPGLEAHEGHDRALQVLQRVEPDVIPEFRGEGFRNLPLMLPDAHRVHRERPDLLLNPLPDDRCLFLVALLKKALQLLQPQEEDPARDGLGRLVLHPLGVHVPVLEVVPEVEDLEVLLTAVR
ncbi:hypothetical protein DSECCO2_514330 [anaerobic digester metagenome]